MHLSLPSLIEIIFAFVVYGEIFAIIVAHSSDKIALLAFVQFA